jgi:TRAP transporter TAXI family solute receptor
MKKIAVVMTVMMATFLIFTGPDLPTYAKGGGGGGGGGSFGGGGRSSFSSSSSASVSRTASVSYTKPSLPATSSGYSKPTQGAWGARSGEGVVSKTPPAATASGYTKPGAVGTPATQSSSGYSKPSAASAAATTPQKVTFSSKSTFDKSATASIQKQKSADSLSAYNKDKAAFKQPEKPFDKGTYANNGLYKSAPVYGSGYNAQRQITVRNNYYGGMGYSPPIYYNSFSPSYGIFNTMFLFWMIDNAHRNTEAAAMMHNYRNDPGYQQYMADMKAKSAENPELKAKLAAAEAKLAETKDKPVDPNYVPKGIPSEAIVSTQAMMAKTPAKAPLNFASGQKSGKYFVFANALKGNASAATVNVLQTAGSMENLKLLLADKADMAIVQSDALAMFDKEFPGQKLSVEQSELYPEFMQMIVNTSSGIKSISDMLDGKVEVCFPKGSGSAVSWDALCAQDPKYKKVPVKLVASNDECLDGVVKNPKLAFFFVSALNSPLLQRAEKIAKEKGTLRLASVDDTHMLDRTDSHGNKIYAFHEIPRDTYPGLQHRWYWNRTIATLSVQAILVLRTEWVKQYGEEALDSLTLSVLETKSEINRTINNPKL